ncbi:P1 family peptidase [Streptomyces sulfonofaciens]|nr:P1 family peptidase [Streptomyces sulfonofaciens]
MRARPSAREIGLAFGDLPPGPHNAITDVPGVRVGHTTVRRAPEVNTGVTAIVPAPAASGAGAAVTPRTPLPAGVFCGNGYGKLVETTQIAELGTIETPVLLTSTLSTFRVADALIGWMLDRPECADVRSLNPVVGECNDGYLSDIRARPITRTHVRAALDGARSGPVAQGCVGAGTGTGALGFKAGIGTASRVLDLAGERATIGVLVQANFPGTLRVLGTPLTPASVGVPPPPALDIAAPGSCMIVAATDAPLDARHLTRLARRAVFALARVGAAYTHSSGDYALALSVHPGPPRLRDQELDPLFEAIMDVVEESVLNSLLTATTTNGPHGRTLHALPTLRLTPPP